MRVTRAVVDELKHEAIKKRRLATAAEQAYEDAAREYWRDAIRDKLGKERYFDKTRPLEAVLAYPEGHVSIRLTDIYIDYDGEEFFECLEYTSKKRWSKMGHLYFAAAALDVIQLPETDHPVRATE